MLEVCFSDSVKGALRMAGHWRKGGRKAIALICSESSLPPSPEETERSLAQARENIAREEEQGIPLGCAPKDVLGLSFGLSMGDISQPFAENSPRRQLLKEWLTANPWGELEEAEASAGKYWANCLKDLSVLKAQAASEPVRLWVDQSPDSLCGLLSLAELLLSARARASVVFLPPWTERHDGTLCHYRGWSEVSPETFGLLAREERSLSAAELGMYSQRWRQLQRENAPLRAFVNGRLVSVPEDFYDGLILQSLSREPITVGALIGRVLVDSLDGVGDWLIARRIRSFLKTGQAELTGQNSERFYQSLIRRGQKQPYNALRQESEAFPDEARQEAF